MISGPVRALVVRARVEGELGKRRHPDKDVVGVTRMTRDQRPVAVRQPTRMVEHAIRHAEFPDIVEQRRTT